jgi:integrase
MGIRSAEVVRLTFGNLAPDGRFVFTGKGRKVRTVTPGPAFLQLLATWRTHYEAAIDRPIAATDPLLCAQRRGRPDRSRTTCIDWSTPLAQDSYYRLVLNHAKLAGLGHVAPHDLRRTAAAILHRDKTPDGGHRFDLLDIAQVLDHSDPAVTQRSYIDQLDLDAKDRAATTLD